MKKWLAASLSALLIAGMFAGCQQPAADESAASPTEASTAAPASSEAETAPAEELTVDNAEPYEFTMYCDWQKLGMVGEIYMNNLAEELNLKINYELPAASGYADSLSLLLASGDYPELVFMPTETSSVFRDACEDGVFISIEKWLDSGLFPSLVEHTGDMAWEALDIFKDGRVWGVPRMSPVRADGYELRADWLRNLGIEFTEGDSLTVDELYDILYQFTYNDPDGNGVNDTYGVWGSTTDYSNLFADAFGITKSTAIGVQGAGWGEYDGEYMCLKYSKTSTAYKEYLTYLGKLWADGLYDPDTFSVDSATADTRYNEGVTGIRSSFPGNIARRITAMQGINPEADLVFAQSIVKNEGDPYTAITPGTGIWQVWTLTNKAEKPERILQLMDRALDDDHWDDLANRGVKGVNYDIDANGNLVDLGASLPEDQQGNQGVIAIIRFLRRNDGPEFFLDLNLTPENRQRYKELTDLTAKNCIYSLDGGYMPPSASEPAFLDYASEMQAQVAQIITGQLPVDAWDGILEGWYNAGGETYVKEMQDYITSTQG